MKKIILILLSVMVGNSYAESIQFEFTINNQEACYIYNQGVYVSKEKRGYAFKYVCSDDLPYQVVISSKNLKIKDMVIFQKNNSITVLDDKEYENISLKDKIFNINYWLLIFFGYIKIIVKLL